MRLPWFIRRMFMWPRERRMCDAIDIISKIAYSDMVWECKQQDLTELEEYIKSLKENITKTII